MLKNSIGKEIKAIQRSLEKIAKVLDEVTVKLRAREGKKSSKYRAHPRTEQLSSSINEHVRDAIAQARKGISVSEIKEKTGLADRQISNALYKLTKKGMVQTKARGVYVTKSRSGSA